MELSKRCALAIEAYVTSYLVFEFYTMNIKLKRIAMTEFLTNVIYLAAENYARYENIVYGNYVIGVMH